MPTSTQMNSLIHFSFLVCSARDRKLTLSAPSLSKELIRNSAHACSCFILLSEHRANEQYHVQMVGNMDLDSSTSSDAVAIQKPFAFFSLPPELRDQIYELLLEPEHPLPSQYGLRFQVKNAINAELLLISHQFKDEYLESAEAKAVIVLEDECEYQGELLQFPSPLRYLRKLEVHLAITCDSHYYAAQDWGVVEEFRMHRNWVMEFMAHTQPLLSLSINLYLAPDAHVESCEQSVLEHHSKLTSLDDLTDLRVYQCKYEEPGKGWDFNVHKVLVMEYSQETEALRRVSVKD